MFVKRMNEKKITVSVKKYIVVTKYHMDNNEGGKITDWILNPLHRSFINFPKRPRVTVDTKKGDYACSVTMVLHPCFNKNSASILQKLNPAFKPR